VQFLSIKIVEAQDLKRWQRSFPVIRMDLAEVRELMDLT
jgi:hypothetical protein